MALTPNTATTFSMTLRVAGVPLTISPAATVTAQVYSADGASALSPVVPVSIDAIGGDWGNGLLAVEFSAGDTANLAPPSAMVIVTVLDGGHQRSWQSVVTVIGGSIGVDEVTALFNRRTAVAMLRDELMISANGIIPGADGLSDDYLWGKLVAAEAYASHKLKVFFAPTEILPDDTLDAEIDALKAAGTRFYQEAAYDYEPDMFRGDRFGLIVLHQKPVIKVHSIVFAYPNVNTQVFTVPSDWIRVDKKYGMVRLVPASGGFNAPLTAFMMQAMGGGRTIPAMLRLRYTAGLDATSPVWADLIDAVRKTAIFKILQSTFPAGSSSISSDGLSQSNSIVMKDWSDSVDELYDNLQSSIHGIRMGFLG